MSCFCILSHASSAKVMIVLLYQYIQCYIFHQKGRKKISLVIHNTETVSIASVYLIDFFIRSVRRKIIYINYLY